MSYINKIMLTVDATHLLKTTTAEVMEVTTNDQCQGGPGCPHHMSDHDAVRLAFHEWSPAKPEQTPKCSWWSSKQVRVFQRMMKTYQTKEDVERWAVPRLTQTYEKITNAALKCMDAVNHRRPPTKPRATETWEESVATLT